MPESLQDQIDREMTEAFDRRNARTMSEEAREALRQFIDHAVVGGIGNDATLFSRYRKYLICRLEHVANGINRKVAAGETVTFDDILEVGLAEVGHPREDCARLIEPAPGGQAEELGREARICGKFSRESIVRPEAVSR